MKDTWKNSKMQVKRLDDILMKNDVFQITVYLQTTLILIYLNHSSQNKYSIV